MEINRLSIYLFSFFLAFCSLFYELVFAQILSVCIGGTKAQYLIVISLFTCALGLGSLLQGHFTKKYKLIKVFFTVEVGLTLLGSIGPFFIVWLMQAKDEAWIFFYGKIFINYMFVFVIGLLSGFEIPCLFAMAKGNQGKVLALDYLGMLVASIAFPFIFLPKLGAAAGALFVANINVQALTWLWPDNFSPALKKIVFTLSLVFFVLIPYFREEINAFLSLLYLVKV